LSLLAVASGCLEVCRDYPPNRVEEKFPEVWEGEAVLRGLGYSPDNTLRIWWLWVKKER